MPPTLTANEHPAQQGMRAVRVGIVVNICLAFVKGVAGIVGNSYALVADAIESSADVFTSVIVLWGLQVALKPADDDHPHGHGKAEPLASLVVCLALVLAAGFISFESVREILTPHKAPAPFTLLVLVSVVITKEILARSVLKAGEDAQSGAVKNDAFHHRADAITSAAAFIGISIALIGGDGYEAADDWAALLAAGVIAYNAGHIGKAALQELMDSAPDQRIETEIRQVAASVPGVEGLHRCRVRKSGFDYYTELDVLVDREMPVWKAHQIAHDVQNAVRAANPRVVRVLVHSEPSEDENDTDD
ncbi:MAG: cation transporter [Fibrella sp.]|nr:cation transporter [Armatimonadota bacterium]